MSYIQQLEQLEAHRSLFLNDNYVALDSQIRRFKSRCGLLNGDLQRGSTDTKKKKIKVKENLERIAAISSALLFLCTSLPEAFIASKGSTQFALKLKDWWQSVSYPRNLEVLVRQLCLEATIDYKETVHIQPDDTEETEHATEEPENTTEEPENTTEEPENTTEEHEITTEQHENTTEEPENNTEEPESNTEEPENTINIFRGQVPLIQAVFIPSERRYIAANFPINELILFIQTSPALSDTSQMIGLLQSYHSSHPHLTLKMPFIEDASNDAPSVEIKLPSFLGSSVVIYFDWGFAHDFLYFLSSPKIANRGGAQEQEPFVGIQYYES
ncbi:hypothetical protein ZTR_11134 [Talaromyces verruculosus]|nr:hypothetical protein ZTR_11134 [Talaromyces verruculosus]